PPLTNANNTIYKYIYIYIYNVFLLEKRTSGAHHCVRRPIGGDRGEEERSEIYGRLGRRRRGGEPGGEVAVARVVPFWAPAVALVEVEGVAEGVVLELRRPHPPASAAATAVPVAVEAADEGLPPRTRHQLRPLPHLHHRPHHPSPPPAVVSRATSAAASVDPLPRLR
ncbi:unnamed protein product, partial [Musa hybrid cultivar]